jgi:hypothetical protein
VSRNVDTSCLSFDYLFYQETAILGVPNAALGPFGKPCVPSSLHRLGEQSDAMCIEYNMLPEVQPSGTRFFDWRNTQSLSQINISQHQPHCRTKD